MRSHRPGFTLVETLLYTAFVGMIMTSMTLLAYTTFSVRGKLRTALILEQNMRFAVGRVTTLVNEASGITSPTLGATSGTLILATTATSTNPTTITSVGGIIYLTQGATGTVEALTSNEISISSFSFTRVSSTSPMVRFVLSGGLRNASTSYGALTVTTTAAVRH